MMLAIIFAPLAFASAPLAPVRPDPPALQRACECCIPLSLNQQRGPRATQPVQSGN